MHLKVKMSAIFDGSMFLWMYSLDSETTYWNISF